MVLSLGFGLVAAIGINQIMKSNQATAIQPVQKMGPVVVAAGDLGLNEFLTEENVKIENWPVDIIPPEAITSLDKITDQATTVRMSKGMPVIATTLKHKKDVIGMNIPKGMKVVAVRVSSEHTVGGLLNPGDKVDVIGIFKQREPRSNRTTTISKTFLKALQVFNINNKTNAVDRGESTGRGGNTIVGLLVTEKQSEALVFAQGTGTIKLVLRGDEVEGDDEEIEDFDKIMAGKFGESETPLQTTAKAISPTHTMVIFKGDQSESQKFGIDGSPERKPVADMVRKERRAPDAGMSKDNGSAKESGNSDNDRNIDDDQYRGE